MFCCQGKNVDMYSALSWTHL